MRSAYFTIAQPMAGPLKSRQLSQGLSKPLPSLRWCLLSLVSSGTAPVIEAGDMVAAYSAAAAPELDILGEVDIGLLGLLLDLWRNWNKKLRKKGMPEARIKGNKSDIE